MATNALPPAISALVVDDMDVNRILLCNMLSHLNVTTTCASNGMEAVTLCQQKHSYDIIFLDCHMPVMSGYEAAKQIRAIYHHGSEIADGDHHPYRLIPIVAVTAAASEEDQRKCYESGMNYFVSKPITITAIQDILTKAELFL